MDDSNMSKSRPNDHLGVNKVGKSIRKSPLHQPNFASSNPNPNPNPNPTNNSGNPARQQPQPQVYNISKTDFRSVVQKLTGSPLHSQNEPLPPRPPNNQPKHPSNRLQRIRPPPLRPINRLLVPNMVPVPHPVPVHPPMQGSPMAMAPRPYQFGPPSPAGMPPFNANWPNPALSPISAYMQQLQSCINGPSSLMSSPRPPLLLPPNQTQPTTSLYQNLPFNSPGLLPSPNSQFLLPSPSMPSPSGFYSLWSSYPFPSPGSAFPPSLSPNFSFPPMGPPGILGPGPQQPLYSPNAFPPSPSVFFPLTSPRWRNQ